MNNFLEKNNFAENKENKIEREKFEKIVILLRHPSVDLEKVAEKGDVSTLWDDIENTASIERGTGHEMSRLLVNHLIDEIPELTKTKEGHRNYGIYSSPIPRAEALARYFLLNLKEKNKHDDKFNIPNNGVKIFDEFAEIPMAYKKGDMLQMAEKIKNKGGDIMLIMKEWFESDPEFIASVFEKERERVLCGLEKLKNDHTSINFIFTHRLLTGFLFYLIENQNNNKPIAPEDLPKIMDFSRQIPYASESEIGFMDGKWHILRKQDVDHLNPGLVKGIF